MEIEQQVFSYPTTRITARIQPADDVYEWTVLEYDQGRCRWVCIDGGASTYWNAALADMARAVSFLAENAF